jgi:hypothetical protein
MGQVQGNSLYLEDHGLIMTRQPVRMLARIRRLSSGASDRQDPLFAILAQR